MRLKFLKRVSRHFQDLGYRASELPREVIEASLAHIVGDKTEAAYARGDLFNKRRKLMEAWAAYCTSPTAAVAAKVVPIRESVP
jgi:hypothetical protein